MVPIFPLLHRLPGRSDSAGLRADSRFSYFLDIAMDLRNSLPLCAIPIAPSFPPLPPFARNGYFFLALEPDFRLAIRISCACSLMEARDGTASSPVVSPSVLT